MSDSTTKLFIQALQEDAEKIIGGIFILYLPNGKVSCHATGLPKKFIDEFCKGLAVCLYEGMVPDAKKPEEDLQTSNVVTLR